MSPLIDAIRRLATGTYLVSRPGPVAWGAGRAIQGPPVTFTILASIQPTGNADLMRLPEGERSKDEIEVWTETELRTATVGGALSDRVVYRGSAYEVEHVHFWEPPGEPPFYNARARKVPL